MSKKVTVEVLDERQRKHIGEELIENIMRYESISTTLQVNRIINDADSLGDLLTLLDGSQPGTFKDGSVQIMLKLLPTLFEFKSKEAKEKLDETVQSIRHMASHVIDDSLAEIQATLMMVHRGFISFTQEADGIELTPIIKTKTLTDPDGARNIQTAFYDVAIKVYEDDETKDMSLELNVIIPLWVDLKLVSKLQGAVFANVDKDGNLHDTVVATKEKDTESVLTKVDELLKPENLPKKNVKQFSTYHSDDTDETPEVEKKDKPSKKKSAPTGTHVN